MECGQRNYTFQFHQIPSNSVNQSPLRVHPPQGASHVFIVEFGVLTMDFTFFSRLGLKSFESADLNDSFSRLIVFLRKTHHCS